MVLVVVFLLSLTLSIACKKKDKTSESVGGSETVSITESISGTQSESKINSGKDSEKISESKSTTESLVSSESEIVSDSKAGSETVSESEKASESEIDSEDTEDSDNSSESEEESEIVYFEGLEFRLNFDGDSYTVVGIHSFEGTELNIPKNYNGKLVTRIGNYAFRDCSGLTSVTIPDSVTSIGEDAFYDCSGLTSITISKNITSIGEGAFNCCSGLTAVYYFGTIDQWAEIYFADFTSNPLYIAGKLYINNELVNEVNLTVATIISSYAFEECSELTSVTIPDSVTDIGRSAFEGCSGLISVIIGKGVTNIGAEAFYNCSEIEKVVWNAENCDFEYVSIEGNGVFGDYLGDYPKITHVTIGENVKTIPSYAFKNCSELKNVIWNAENCTITNGDQYPMFTGCNKITDVTIGNKVKTIPAYAFCICRELTSMTIPESVTNIGQYAFQYCHKLVEVINNSDLNVVKGSEEYGGVAFYALNVKKGGTTDIVNKNGYLFYASDNVSYLLGYVGNETELTLPNDYDGQNYEICKYAFSGCSELMEELIIPDSVTSIGDSAFYHCSNLTSITIGNGVTNIGDSAFEWCSGLTSLIIPDSVKSIGEEAFRGCSGLKSVTIGNGIKNIKRGTFSGCSGLISIIIPDNVTGIGTYAFMYCSGLASITIPDSVTGIGSDVFSGCSDSMSIIFKGTMEQWNNIEKGFSWDDDNADNYTIYCIDGEIKKQ